MSIGLFAQDFPGLSRNLLKNGDFTLGPELIANGQFDNGLHGWANGSTNGRGELIEGGGLRVYNTTNAWGAVSQLISGVAGKTLVVSLTRRQGTRPAWVNLYDVTANSSLKGDSNTSAAWNTETFTITPTGNLNIILQVEGGDVGDYADFDNISVREVIGWTAYNAMSKITIANNAMTVTGDGGDAFVYQAVPVVPGEHYCVEFDLDAVVSGTGFFRVTKDGPLNGPLVAVQSFAVGASGKKTYCFTATGTQAYVTFSVGQGASITVSNVRVTRATPDRSYNSLGAIIHGKLTRSPVAAGAELQAWSGFTANDYLEIPYSSRFDYGTGDFFVAGWFKITDTNFAIPFSRREGAQHQGRIQIFCQNAGKFAFYTHDGTTGLSVESPFAYVGQWAFVVCAVRGGKREIWVNGALSGETTPATQNTMSRVNATIRLGCNQDGASPFGGSIALVRTGAYAPTPAQIEKMFRQESKLFQANAACTLNGTSDDVRALAKDEDTNLLYVGTNGGGVSVFDGLVRVNAIDAMSKAVGPELVTNGDFSAGATGWATNNGSTPAIDTDGWLVFTDTTGSVFDSCEQTITTQVGKTYFVQALVKSVTATEVLVGATNSAAGFAAWSKTAARTPTVLSLSFVADTTATRIILRAEGTVLSGGVAARLVSVKEAGDLTSNNVVSLDSSDEHLVIGTDKGVYAEIPSKLARESEVIALPTYPRVVKDVTVDATPKVLAGSMIKVGPGERVVATATVTATEYGKSLGATYTIRGTFLRDPDAGVTMAESQHIGTPNERVSTMDLTWTVDMTTQTARLTATGVSGTRYVWEGTVTVNRTSDVEYV